MDEENYEVCENCGAMQSASEFEFAPCLVCGFDPETEGQ